MAQPLCGLAPQIPNVSLVWNLKNKRFLLIIDGKCNIMVDFHSKDCRELLQNTNCSSSILMFKTRDIAEKYRANYEKIDIVRHANADLAVSVKSVEAYFVIFRNYAVLICSFNCR